MANKVNRWLRSRAGMRTMAGILAIVLVVAVAGAVFGWWADLADLLRGTAGPPGGYTCLPSCEVEDGKFLSHVGESMASFSGNKIVAWLTIPAGNNSFDLGVFDGDSGKDDQGGFQIWEGNWDNTQTETTYTLYADPFKDGTGSLVVGTWYGNQMLNNAWYDITINTQAEAQAPSGTYNYRLECTRPIQGAGINAFKLRSTGYLSTGRADLADASFAIVGMLATLNDVPILWPDYSGSWDNMGPSVYSGDWDFYLLVEPPPGNQITEFEFWDGDFDRGTSSAPPPGDTDDANTEGKPPWAGSYAVNERAGGRGAPADDYGNFLYRREPPVWYEITDPQGVPIHTNNEPSGTEEWEKFLVSVDPGANPDVLTNEILPGYYNVHIQGLDLHNTVWIRSNYEIVTIPPPPPCSATCPRTIGYWKNNVNKILIQGKTGGVQETADSIHAALYLIAQYSPLFRSGIDVLNPQPIDAKVPLSDQEADMILMRDKKNYPGDNKSSQTMLARALQQNLATWLNVMSGKICNDTYVTLDAYGGYFEGTVWDALQEAQTIMLNHDEGQMERAKDIGDLINNGLLGEDAETSVCDDYTPIMPPDLQPPDPEDLPVAPEPPEPPDPETPPITCDAPRVNTYGVENPTNNPFYGIKFEYQSGTEIKDSGFDEFRFVLPADVAAGMTSVQVEAKAGTDQAIASVTLDNCAFDSPIPCGDPVMDANGSFAFYFVGAEDNGDGTLTLVFQVQNMTGHGLSHATFGLPDGIVPSGPNGSYQSEVCP